MTEIEVFTSKTCPHCPVAKKVVKEVSKDFEDLKILDFDIASGRGKRLSKQLGVSTVPTIFVKNEFNERIGIRGTPTKAHLRKVIRESRGEIIEQKGLVSKILSVFGN